MVVENRAGAAGNIAGEFVATSDPDGYTLLAAQPSPLTINPLLYKKMDFDPTQFEPVAIMTTVANVLLVRPDFPAKTAQEFIAYVKANPGKINYASQGIGTTSHLTAALFEKVTGTKLVHVPYRGTSPALNDLIASHVDFIFMELASAIKLHEGGRARILAVATDKRIPNLPDIPTLDEAGVKGFESGTWNAIAAPPKTPAAIVAKLNKAVNEVLKSPEALAHFGKINLHAAGGSPAEAKAFIQQGNHALGQRDQRGECAGELPDAPITIHRLKAKDHLPLALRISDSIFKQQTCVSARILCGPGNAVSFSVPLKDEGMARRAAQHLVMCTHRCGRVAPLGAPSRRFPAPGRAFQLTVSPRLRLFCRDPFWAAAPSSLGQA